MLSHAFMVHALLASTGVALAAGPVGYLLVLRAQVFTADALSHVAFTGALAALAFGIDPQVGVVAVTLAVALGTGLLGRQGRPDDVVIGGIFAWVLGLGVLFLSLFTSSRSGSNGAAAIAVLFGSVLGVSGPRALAVSATGVLVALALVVIARPLVFATLDEAVARARGVRVRALGLALLLLLAVTTAEASEVVGTLLVLGLVAGPAVVATAVTRSPWRGLACATAVAVVAAWGGLALSYTVRAVPPSFGVLAIVVLLILVAHGVPAVRRALSQAHRAARRHLAWRS